jgi:branched-chain amino acid transport system ATP-binding protein
MTLLHVAGLSKRFGGLAATDGVELTVNAGEVHAVIGPNGAGKTTLINQLAGEIVPDAGSIHLEGRDITRARVYERALLGMGRSYQITSVFAEFSVLVNVMLAVQAHAGHSFSFWRPLKSETALVEQARAALAEVGLAGKAQAPVATLAHGERRQLEVAMTLATRPKLLLLDEPMAGRYGVLLVEHDMDAVFKLADRISVLVYGRVIACGDAAAIRANPDVRAAYLGDQEVTA